MVWWSHMAVTMTCLESSIPSIISPGYPDLFGADPSGRDVGCWVSLTLVAWCNSFYYQTRPLSAGNAKILLHRSRRLTCTSRVQFCPPVVHTIGSVSPYNRPDTAHISQTLPYNAGPHHAQAHTIPAGSPHRRAPPVGTFIITQGLPA